jgi:hypothetical protein
MAKGSSAKDTEFQWWGQDEAPSAVLAFVNYLSYNGLQINCRA